MAVEQNGDTYSYQDSAGNTDEARLVLAYPPKKLLTDADGDNARLRVDVGQTGFFDGREFRTFRRIAVASAETLVIKAVVPINVILFDLRLEMLDGWADVETRVGGTEVGSFSETLPIIAKNAMSTAPSYSPVVELTAGGTLTGGTVIDVMAARAATATAQVSSVGMSIADERGIAAGTYYFVVTNPGSGTNNGVFRAWWGERP